MTEEKKSTTMTSWLRSVSKGCFLFSYISFLQLHDGVFRHRGKSPTRVAKRGPLEIWSTLGSALLAVARVSEITLSITFGWKTHGKHAYRDSAV